MARNYFYQSDIISGYISSVEEDDLIESDVDDGNISDGAIIGSDGDFESSESDSDIDEPPNRRCRTADRIPAADTNAEFV